MRFRLAALIVSLTVLATPGVGTVAPAATFLMTAFHVSAADIERLDADEVISRTLDVKNHREIATLGIVRIKTSPSTYVAGLADIVAFKRTEGVLQIGTFTNPPQRQDVASLTID